MKKYLTKEFLLDHKKQVAEIAILLVVLITGSIIYVSGTDDSSISINDTQQAEASTTGEEESSTEAVSTGEVTVDISGAVQDSCVVTLPEGSRVQDAIEEAGGVSSDADLSTINRAAVLTDGEKIYIPTEDETASGVTYQADSQSETSSEGLVNINTADESQLEELDGIGPVTAEKIIEYRTTYGSFSSIEDIKEVNGIGDKTYANIKDSITVQ